MEPIDVSSTIVAKSDQLNADDLIGGRELVVQVTGVAKVAGEQPVVVHITGGHQPWKPCKTMRRVLVEAWGADASRWVGRWLTLYRDPGVKWSDKPVGGIRIRAMSDIPRRVTLSLAETRGKKVQHIIEIMRPPSAVPQSLEEHVAAYAACDSVEALAALDAERARVWPALSKADKATLKTAADAARARLDTSPQSPAGDADKGVAE
jgi:hypothetical protein